MPGGFGPNRGAPQEDFTLHRGGGPFASGTGAPGHSAGQYPGLRAGHSGAGQSGSV